MTPTLTLVDHLLVLLTAIVGVWAGNRVSPGQVRALFARVAALELWAKGLGFKRPAPVPAPVAPGGK